MHAIHPATRKRRPIKWTGRAAREHTEVPGLILVVTLEWSTTRRARGVATDIFYCAVERSNDGATDSMVKLVQLDHFVKGRAQDKIENLSYSLIVGATFLHGCCQLERDPSACCIFFGLCWAWVG